MILLDIAVLLVVAYGAKVIGVALLDAVEAIRSRRDARRCGRSKVQVCRLYGASRNQVKPEHIRKVGGF